MKSDKLLSTVLLVLSTIIFFYTLDFPLEAAIYPRAISVIIFILSLILFIRPQRTKVTTFKSIARGIMRNKNVVFVCLLTLAFVLSINYMGFFGALPIYLIAIQLILGERNIIKILIPTFIVTITIYIIFIMILKIPMPTFWFES